jgi:hypothetical protein
LLLLQGRVFTRLSCYTNPIKRRGIDARGPRALPFAQLGVRDTEHVRLRAVAHWHTDRSVTEPHSTGTTGRCCRPGEGLARGQMAAAASSRDFPSGLRVMVVDDDPLCLRVVEQMLKRCSYEVLTCTNALSALELLRAKRNGFDLVLSDVYMPGEAHVGLGKEAAAAAAAAARGAPVPGPTEGAGRPTAGAGPAARLAAARSSGRRPTAVLFPPGHRVPGRPRGRSMGGGPAESPRTARGRARPLPTPQHTPLLVPPAARHGRVQAAGDCGAGAGAARHQ